jgi:hypothetical protein
MAKVNLTGMNVEALLSLRTQVDERLAELRTELEKQLAALGGGAGGQTLPKPSRQWVCEQIVKICKVWV